MEQSAVEAQERRFTPDEINLMSLELIQRVQARYEPGRDRKVTPENVYQPAIVDFREEIEASHVVGRRTLLELRIAKRIETGYRSTYAWLTHQALAGSRLLVETAASLHFRELFINDPNLGGRYSALSYFGLVPAALVVDRLPTDHHDIPVEYLATEEGVIETA